MAVTTVDHLPVDPPDTFEPPPTIAVTPSDPWPRPYYLEGGLRRVAPYHYTYNTYCKERWRNREILDIFGSEFRDRPKEYYKTAIENGNVVLNGKPFPSIHTIVKNGDVISHTLHRHEPPVTAQPIRVVYENNDMIVIDKPAGVPVHPAGRYNFNSIVEIMRAERGYQWNPLPCNRLDRLTSGVMFIGKHKAAAEEISQKLRGRTVQKEYVARVKGRFPDGDGSLGRGVVKCEENILQISPILGLNRARATGKPAKTLFRRIAWYPNGNFRPRQPERDRGNNAATEQDQTGAATPTAPTLGTEDEGYSIVHCLPLTGRTHQLRVHLQFLGHSITNDPIYSNRRVFGPDLGRDDASDARDAEIIAKLSNMGKTEIADSIHYGSLTFPQIKEELEQERKGEGPGYDQKYGDAIKLHDRMVKEYNRKKGEKMTGEKCAVCDTELYSDPGVHELGIFLHAVAYSDTLGKWRYQSSMPYWALPPDGFDGPRELPKWEDAERVVGGDEYVKNADLTAGLGDMKIS